MSRHLAPRCCRRCHRFVRRTPEIAEDWAENYGRFRRIRIPMVECRACGYWQEVVA